MTSSLVSPSFASRSRRSPNGRENLLIARFTRSRASVSHFGNNGRRRGRAGERQSHRRVRNDPLIYGPLTKSTRPVGEVSHGRGQFCSDLHRKCGRGARTPTAGWCCIGCAGAAASITKRSVPSLSPSRGGQRRTTSAAAARPAVDSVSSRTSISAGLRSRLRPLERATARARSDLPAWVGQRCRATGDDGRPSRPTMEIQAA